MILHVECVNPQLALLSYDSSHLNLSQKQHCYLEIDCDHPDGIVIMIVHAFIWFSLKLTRLHSIGWTSITLMQKIGIVNRLKCV